MTLRPPSNPSPTIGNSSETHRILIVDDERAVLFAYRRLIETEGFEVDTCESLSEAMAMICRRLYLAVITDMRLAGTDNEDGIELLHFIKKMQSDTRVIIATGYSNEDLKQTSQTLGAAHYFEKPVLPSAILTALKTISATTRIASQRELVDGC